MKRVLLIGNTTKGNVTISIIHDTDITVKNCFTVATRFSKIRTSNAETAAKIYATSTGTDVAQVINHLTNKMQVR